MTRTYGSAPYGRRTLPETLANLATTEPDRIYASIPKTADVAHGFRDVLVPDMERMSNALAGWIHDHWGRSSTFETIAYVGISDLRGVAVFFAAVRNGYKTACSKIIHAPEVKPLVDQICQLRTATLLPLPSFDEVLLLAPREVTLGKRPYDEVKNDPILVLHSSGSTGLPKPITMTHATFAVLDCERFLPTVEGRVNRDYSIWDFEGGGKFYTIFPFFHLSGFLAQVINPIFTESSSPVIGPAQSLPSAPLMKKVLDQQPVRALHISPSIAEQLLTEPNGLDYFRNLDFICYTGSPFSPIAGEKLVQVTSLISLYGSTEAFQTPQLVPSKEDWAYMEWNPHFRYEMQPAEDGTYEMVLFADDSTEKMSALNHNVPGVHEWRTKDLFTRHPSKPSLWQYYGRRDDIIVLSSGEKFNPIPTELTVGSSELLSGALVVGYSRSQPGILLEPKPDTNLGGQQLIEKVWSLIERANAAASPAGQISPSKVRVVAPGAFVRAGKGTIVRKLSEQSLKEEVAQIYS